MKELKDQCAILSDNPSPNEARVVLEGDSYEMGGVTYNSRLVLFEGSLEVAERLMSCWNIQLGSPTNRLKRVTEIAEGLIRDADELKRLADTQQRLQEATIELLKGVKS